MSNKSIIFHRHGLLHATSFRFDPMSFGLAKMLSNRCSSFGCLLVNRYENDPVFIRCDQLSDTFTSFFNFQCHNEHHLPNQMSSISIFSLLYVTSWSIVCNNRYNLIFLIWKICFEASTMSTSNRWLLLQTGFDVSHRRWHDVYDCVQANSNSNTVCVWWARA